MATSVNALRLRQRLGRHLYRPPRPFGPDGWSLTARDGSRSVIVTVADHDGAEWVHASIAGRDHLPSYEDLVMLHGAAFDNAWAYQVFAPSEHHVNIHPHALHLWGRLDGAAALPLFAEFGSI